MRSVIDAATCRRRGQGRGGVGWGEEQGRGGEDEGKCRKKAMGRADKGH